MLNKWPNYEEDEIKAVSDILMSGNVISFNGALGLEFEKEFSKFCDCKYSLTLSNGTAALLSAYKSIDLGPEDEIITTPRSFVATASAALELGAKPIFADVDLNSGCITAESIRPMISDKTKAISVVHLAGWPAEMEEIQYLAKKNNLFVIEDCSQAHGAEINGKSVGSFSDIATWSFCADKIISTGGEGGMISTNNQALRDIIWSYRNHGKSEHKLENFQKNNFLYKWIHDKIGINLRLTEMQSAIGLIQLKKIKKWQEVRTKNANVFIEKLSDISCVRIPKPFPNIKHAWYKFYLYIIENKLKRNWTRDLIIEEINKNGFPAFQGSCGELYLENCFKKTSSTIRSLKNARSLSSTSIMLLVHPTITNSQILDYASCVRNVLNRASKF